MLNTHTAAKLTGVLLAAALVAGAGVASAQLNYDTGAPGSGSVGTIIPGTTTSSGTNTTSTAPGIPNTGAGAADTTGTMSTVTPGVPNTGAGGDAATAFVLLGLAAVIAAGGAIYLFRRPASDAL